jgi:hypothetical protein
MTTMDDINALLDDADEQIGVIQALHDPALSDEKERRRFRTRVKNVLENQRSALDYLSVGITEKYGKPKGLIYYPLAQSEQDFAAQMDGKMPGVAAARPDIADAIKRRQPYLQTHEWLRQLNQLTREHKHNRLAVQMVRETYLCRVIEKRTGAYVAWQGLNLLPGRIESMGGTIEFRPNPNRKPASPLLFELAGPTGFMVFGVPVDTETQQPIPSPELDVQKGPIELWYFVTPHLPVVVGIRDFQRGVREAITDIVHVAPL